MAESTKIEWADHTASPWHGCVEVHAGCDNCYARTMAKRNPGTLGVWGKDGTRVMSASFAKNCRRWNASAKKRGVIETVFPSICDIFEDWLGPIMDSHGGVMWYPPKELLVPPFAIQPQQDEAMQKTPLGGRRMTMDDLRRDTFAIIDECQHLRFLLLTKRPQNVRRMWVGVDGSTDVKIHEVGLDPQKEWFYRPNVALITSISDQATADAMIPELLKCRDLCAILGVSAEPLLGPVDLFAAIAGDCPNCGHDLKDHSPKSRIVGCQCGDGTDENPICGCRTIFRDLVNWVILGGESGHGARPYDLAWARSIISQCREAGVPVFHKQLGSKPTCGHDSGLNQSKISRILGSDARCLRCGFAYPKDPKGGDMSEWPEDLRVREYPAWEPYRA